MLLEKIIYSFVNYSDNEQDDSTKFDTIFKNLLSALNTPTDTVSATYALEQIIFLTTRFPGKHVFNEEKAQYLCEHLNEMYQLQLDYRHLLNIYHRWLPTSKHRHQLFARSHYAIVDKSIDDLNYLLTQCEENNDNDASRIRYLIIANNLAGKLYQQLQSLESSKINVSEYVKPYNELSDRLKLLNVSAQQTSTQKLKNG